MKLWALFERDGLALWESREELRNEQLWRMSTALAERAAGYLTFWKPSNQSLRPPFLIFISVIFILNFQYSIYSFPDVMLDNSGGGVEVGQWESQRAVWEPCNRTTEQHCGRVKWWQWHSGAVTDSGTVTQCSSQWKPMTASESQWQTVTAVTDSYKLA